MLCYFFVWILLPSGGLSVYTKPNKWTNDRRCRYKTCSGPPSVRGNNVDSFDDFSGNTDYLAVVNYKCMVGRGFNTAATPTVLRATCGKKCNINSYDAHGWGNCPWTTTECSWSNDPTWQYSFPGSLPACSIGDTAASSTLFV
jgi:hypothetical protein